MCDSTSGFDIHVTKMCCKAGPLGVHYFSFPYGKWNIVLVAIDEARCIDDRSVDA